MESLQNFDEQVKKHYRYNFTLGILEGTNFWFGYSFFAPSVILPLFVSHLTSNPFLIGLVAVISSAGFLFPQLFTANWVEHLPLKKFLPVNIGFFIERVPVFCLPLVVAILAPISQTWVLIAFFIFYGWHSIGSGLTTVAWQDMIGKVIPVQRRGLYTGLVNFLGTAAGIFGAALAAYFLGRYPFPTGFVISFAVAAFFMFTSWVCTALVREPALAHRKERVSNSEYWRKLPGLLRKNPNYILFLVALFIFNLGTMGAAFQAVYTSEHWHLPDSQVGLFTSALLVGQALVNLLFGPLADRKGYKVVIELTMLASVLSAILTLLAPGPAWMYLSFAMRGISNIGFIYIMTFSLEFGSPDVRPTYIGMTNTVCGVAVGIAPMIGGWLVSQYGYPMVFIVAVVAGLLGMALLHWKVTDPRHAAEQLLKIQNRSVPEP